jgi:hypothetical protein
VLRSTGRQRHWQVGVAVVCAIALVLVGARYFWVRHERRHTEHTVLVLTRETESGLALLHRVTSTRAAADARNATVQAQRDGVRALAAEMHTDLDRTRADTTAAQVGAFTSGSQANNLAACLTGVSQALNQLAVGDSGAIGSLHAVDASCRAAGIA